MCGICLLAVLLVLKRKKNGTKPAKVAIELNHSFTPLDNQGAVTNYTKKKESVAS